MTKTSNFAQFMKNTAAIQQKSIKWLIDDEYISGQIISVNGGWNI